MSYGSWFGGLFMLKLDANTGLRDYSYKYETKTNYFEIDTNKSVKMLVPKKNINKLFLK